MVGERVAGPAAGWVRAHAPMTVSSPRQPATADCCSVLCPRRHFARSSIEKLYVPQGECDDDHT